MIPDEQVARIRHPFHAEHWKIGTIATELLLHPDTSQYTQLGPWAEHVNTYTKLIQEQGYAPASAYEHIQVLLRFGKWLRRRHTKIRALDEILVRRFLRYQAKARSVRSSAAAALYRFLRLLRHQGVTPPQKKPPLSPKQRLLTNYERHLLEERGLTQGTAVHYVGFVDLFLSTRFQKAPLELYQLRARDVRGFVCRQAQILSPTRAQLLVTALRSFLRYLRHQGKITTDLGVCVPTVARWSFATLPRFLPAKSIRRVLECSKQQRTSIGLRDYAILLLLARLGLRASEVATLDLEDIDWENARVSIRGKGGPWDQMPLPTDVGKAVALYLRHGRPPCSCRRVFILGRAPRQAMSRGTIGRLVRAALERAGVDSVHKGPHLFRHSLATNMIRQGASLDEIGELLRHQSPHTTQIYAKVDLPALRRLALPWPGGAR